MKEIAKEDYIAAFNVFLAENVDDDYQKFIFNEVWLDFMEAQESVKTLKNITLLVNEKYQKDIELANKIKLLFVLLAVGFYLSDNFFQKKLSSRWESISKTAILLAVYNFTGVLPQMYICKLNIAEDVRVNALIFITNFLNKQALSSSDIGSDYKKSSNVPYKELIEILGEI